jgi:hypothetical protein
MGALPFKVRSAQRAHDDEFSMSLPAQVIDEAALVGFFPDRQAWTRSTPGFEDFGTRPRPRTDPFEKVQDQWLYGVRHRNLRR